MKIYQALGPNLIVKMEVGEIKSKSGIILATEGSREAVAREEAVIEQLGEDAFTDLKEENRPVVGDKVYFKRYEGTTVVDAKDSPDGLERRVIQDTRVLCLVREK